MPKKRIKMKSPSEILEGLRKIDPSDVEKLHCSNCGTTVSSAIPAGTIVAADIMCKKCKKDMEELVAKQREEAERTAKELALQKKAVDEYATRTQRAGRQFPPRPGNHGGSGPYSRPEPSTNFDWRNKNHMPDLKYIRIDKCRHCWFCHPYNHMTGLQHGRFTGFCEYYRAVLKDIDARPVECGVVGFKIDFEERPITYRDRNGEFTYR